MVTLAAAMALVACADDVVPRQADRDTSQGLTVAQLDSPGDVAYVARGTVAEELRFNATVDVIDRQAVPAPITGAISGPLPTRGTQVTAGDALFAMAPSPELRAIAAQLEAALLARQLGIGDADRLEARVQVATARAEEAGLPTDDRALLPLADEILVEAPISGTVLVSHPPEGGLATQGDILVELGDTSDLIVAMSLPSEAGEHVAVDSRVIVATRDGRGEPVEGTVISIEAPEEPEGESGDVFVAIDLDDDLFEYGTGVRVAITGASREDVLWLPPEAIRGFNGSSFVIVVEGGETRRVDVEVGVTTEDQVEVTGSLAVGDQVVGP